MITIPKYWLAVGTLKNWETAFEYGNIWGLKATTKHTMLWKNLSQGDKVLFYAISPVSGIIGYGVVRTKFRQDKPLWPQEVKENKVIWPHRFEFDVENCLPKDKWASHKVISDKLKAIVQGGFQPISEEIAHEIISTLSPKPITVTVERVVDKHKEIKEKLLEIGRLQKFIVESEYDMDGGKLDVVWRRVERAVPTYVFEIQIGGNLYQALFKLKDAFDLWNSNIFLVTRTEDVDRARQLLTGALHEIRDKLKLLEVEKVYELFKRKKAYRDFEAGLGIL